MDTIERPLFAARQPPHNIVAEQALLGTMMANVKAVHAVEDILCAEHFVDPVHARIFQLIVDGVRAGRVMDPITLRGALEHAGILDECGGVAYLGQLVTAMVGVISAGDYGRVIRDAWVRRTLVTELGPVLEFCFAPPDGGTAEILEIAETTLQRIATDAGDDEPTTGFGNAVRQAVDGAKAASKRGDGLAGLDTGYSALNRMLMGLLPDNLLLLAGRPSMGKTGLGLGIATRVAARGNRVLFWSGEMTAAQLGARAAAAHADLDTVAVFTARRLVAPHLAEIHDREPLTQADWAALQRAEAAAARLPLEIDTRAGISVAQLRARARRMLRQKAGLKLIVVDYVGLMSGTIAAQKQGKYAEVTEISKGLKALAKELHVPVVALVQLNRGPEGREDKRPSTADLRDSGALEQDADAIGFIYRPHYYLSRTGAPERQARETDETYANRCSDLALRTKNSVGVAEFIIPKNRHGPTGTTRLRFTDRTTWFRDESEDDISPAWPSFMESI